MELLSDEKILKVLLGYNPWWATGQVPKELAKPVRRLAFFEAKKAFEHNSIRRYVLLVGPRRVGKTTIMYQMIQYYLTRVTSKNILYVSFDHPLLKLCDIGRILEVYQLNIAPADSELYLFLDEVQYATDWNSWLKTLYDTQPRFRIMATGSASPLLVERMKESGVGRWTEFLVPTLSFYEYLELMGVDAPSIPKDVKPTALSSLPHNQLASLMVSLQPLQQHFHRYLLVGGFPEVALSDDVLYGQKIIREDVVDKVLKRDMISLFGIRNVSELEKIFLYLCMTSGNIVVQDTIAKEIGVSRQTVANYLELLAQGNLIYMSLPADLSGKKVLKAKPKIYLADPAIRNAVLMAGEEILADPAEMGMVVETTVYKHIHSFFYAQRPSLGYYRNPKTDKEIDIVVSFPRRRIIIEVKYREGAGVTDREAIVEWANDDRTAAAVLVTKNSDDYGVIHSLKTKCPVLRIPAFAFLYLLGHAERAGYQDVL